jgi:S-adenosylmethionine:tRNA ribosyltransferase-isomerase
VKLSDFDFELPEDLVAQRPLSDREASRMMVVHRRTGKIEDRKFTDLPDYITPKDILVFNKTKVVKARLIGRRETGGRVEIFLVKRLSTNRYHCLVKATAAKKIGLRISFGEFLRGEILAATDQPMIFEVALTSPDNRIDFWIDQYGRVPLPPYIHREADGADSDRYQTHYASEPGSVAAPTAGLHFTPGMMARLAARGADLREVILHVGLGTFQPIKSELVLEHHMHSEEFKVSAELAAACAAAKKDGRRVIAVGTTSVRALESAARGRQETTDIFLKPGDEFHWVDAMFTNFHQPKSTLIVMMAAFMGRPELWREAYGKAVEQKYRFFSYGDCMLVVDE